MFPSFSPGMTSSTSSRNLQPLTGRLIPQAFIFDHICTFDFDDLRSGHLLPPPVLLLLLRLLLLRPPVLGPETQLNNGKKGDKPNMVRRAPTKLTKQTREF